MTNESGLSQENIAGLRALSMADAIRFWDAMEASGRRDNKLDGVVRSLVLADLFYLLVRVCRRQDMLHPWVYARVREVEACPDGMLDLWARGHFKSSTITFGKTIQDILADPEITFGIFSHTRPIAKAFLRQIMREFEANAILQTVFPDVLWGQDTRAAPKWSEDDGIIVRRKSNPPEATVEAWGLVDGQPTSKHFKVLLYDDIVVEASVNTPEMIEKTMKALEQSYNLASESFSRRFIGTRWHFGDAYKTVRDRGTAVAREHPGTKDGTEDGEPVFWSREMLRQKRRDMGPYTFAAQILLDPKADALKGFRREWLRHHDGIDRHAAQRMTRYLLVDPAGGKGRSSDYTSMWVVGLGRDRNYYALDMVRDRLSLTERAARMMALHRKWQPLQVRYERYGLMADIEHIKTVQAAENYRFDIFEVAGIVSKENRIGRLLPLFEQGRIWLPRSLHVTDYAKKVRDLVYDFIEEEYAPFPVGLHDDMLDGLARIAEPELPLVWPKEEDVATDWYGRPVAPVVDGAETHYWGID